LQATDSGNPVFARVADCLIALDVETLRRGEDGQISNVH